MLGLFVISEQATVYASMATEEEVIAAVIEELDEIFEGQASASMAQVNRPTESLRGF